MHDPDDITEDRGLKALFTAYPLETVEVFAPELIAERGRPTTVTALAQEWPLPELGDPSRFLDVALLATWPDGFTAVVLLIEHWSQVRHIDLTRVHWYAATLGLQHPGAVVLPVILVTERGAQRIPDRLTWTVAGMQILDFHARAVHVGPDDLPRLRSLQNRVAAILSSLAIHDAVEAVAGAMIALVHAHAAPDDIRRFLPLAMKLARMTTNDQPRFHARMREDDTMTTIFDVVEAQGEARGEANGRAAGKAEATVAILRDLVASGVLTIDAAHNEVRRLVAMGTLPEQVGHEAIQRLG